MAGFESSGRPLLELQVVVRKPSETTAICRQVATTGAEKYSVQFEKTLHVLWPGWEGVRDKRIREILRLRKTG